MSSNKFHLFQAAVDEQFAFMRDQGCGFYVVDATKDELWDTYLASFPEGSNPMFRERTEHDCQCCKQFVRRMGKVVTTDCDGNLQSVWHCTVDDPNYQAVADGMAALIESKKIVSPFYHYENSVGARETTALDEKNNVEVWNHFQCDLPDDVKLDKSRIDTQISNERGARDVFVRSCAELSPDAVADVLDLIESKALYRGEEHVRTLKKFQQLQGIFLAQSPGYKRDIDAWHIAMAESGSVTRIRNTSIGTLLIDLSGGMDLESAVKRYEAVVAPSNYKRPTALVTPTMIKKAQETVEELGMMDSLPRRHAIMTDITVNNVLWADRSAKAAMKGKNVFEEMIEEAPLNPDSLKNCDEMTLEFFENNFEGTASIEILLENRLQGNLMSLIAPEYPEAPNMLKWDNNFTWSYNGDLADSMKQRVKAAGGKVDGVLRVSLQWNTDEHDGSDLDLHCIEPDRNHIYFGNKGMVHRSSGRLDVDITNPQRGIPAVENITWSDERKMVEGKYQFFVHNYARRNPNRGFQAEFEYDGEIRSYEYTKDIRQDENVAVVSCELGPTGIKILEELPTTLSSREVWGMKTMRFQRVSAILKSPNHWDDNSTGNEHRFFIVDGCQQPGSIRGFFNEQLNDTLREHRKVFEVLGTKIQVEEASDQLSGLGFSSTQRNHAFVRLNGEKVIKLTF